MHVLLKPSTETLARVIESPVAGSVVMTDAELKAWIAQEIAGGWAPPRKAPPFADAAALRIALVTEGWVTVGSPTTAIADLNAWAAAHIAALGTAVQRTKAHIKWQFAGSFAFDDPLIVHFATRDSKTVAQRGALFIAAEDIS